MNNMHARHWWGAGWAVLAEIAGRLRLLVALVVYVAVLFPAAGRLDWDRGWLFVALYAAFLLVNAPIVARKNPELLRERLKTHEGTKPFDRLFALLYAVGLVAVLALAGLDAGRFGWSVLPGWTVALGIVLFALSDVPILGSLIANRHLETTVRIQSDRGHSVVTTGPYRFVRHPMYVGMLVQLVGTPLVLGSLWAFAPTLFMVCIMVWRTAREDTTLRLELEGYEEYTRVTRYRLVPGVW